jgi:hypothetical protein
MKTTKATLRQRVEEILTIRLAGAQFIDVRQYVAEKEAAAEPPWTVPEGGRPLSDRSLWRYIQRTDKLIAESCREGRKRRLNRHLAQRRHLFGLAVNQGDIRAALAVLDSEAKLHGLFPPAKIAPTDPTGAKEYGESLSDAERAAALAQLYARLGAPGGGPDSDGQADGDGPLLDRPGADTE